LGAIEQYTRLELRVTGAEKDDIMEAINIVRESQGKNVNEALVYICSRYIQANMS